MTQFVSQLKGDYGFYVVGNTAYNPMDAGNFVWGVAMSKLGFDYATVKVSSEVNAVINGKRQNNQGLGITWGGDSPADQKAIAAGYIWNKIRGK